MAKWVVESVKLEVKAAESAAEIEGMAEIEGAAKIECTAEIEGETIRLKDIIIQRLFCLQSRRNDIHVPLIIL